MYILAAVKNCEKHLPQIFCNIDSLRTIYPDLHCIFIYDHCSDKTGTILMEYAAKHKPNIYVEELFDNNSKLRTERIAYARNRCLTIFYERQINSDYFIFIDADNVNENPWNVNKMKEIMEKNQIENTWDCLSFNRDPYYDIWALLLLNHSHHCWGFGVQSPKIVRYLKEYMKLKLQICEEEMIEVHSAFNGLAIYKKEKFTNCVYSGNIDVFMKEEFFTKEEIIKTLHYYRKQLKNEFIFIQPLRTTFLDPKEICEHLYFHLMAKKKNHARIYISKSSIFL